MAEVAEVIELSVVERLVRELGTVGQVKIKTRENGAQWWVQLEPFECAPLWWYAQDESLEAALREVYGKAVTMGFIKAAAEV